MEEGIVYVIVFFAGLAVAVMYSCLVVSSRESRKEENRKGQPCVHCETCNRWDECNGVDPECPWKKGVAQ